MIYLQEKTLGRNAMLAGTHSERDETGYNQVGNKDGRNVLKRRKVSQLHILLHLFQEHLNLSLDLCSLKDCVVLRVGPLRSSRM